MVDYLQETLTGDALNYIEENLNDDPNTPLYTILKLMSERYNSINRQKEVSDRLHTMRYQDFPEKGESPATTLDKITNYIDKMAMLALPVDRTDEAKARFVSNVTRGQIWAYNAKGRISATASYDRIIQAFATSIRDRAELECGRLNRGKSSRNSYQRTELQGSKGQMGDSTEINSDDEIF